MSIETQQNIPYSYFAKISPEMGCFLKAKYAIKEDSGAVTVLYEPISKKEYDSLVDNKAVPVQIKLV